MINAKCFVLLDYVLSVLLKVIRSGGAVKNSDETWVAFDLGNVTKQVIVARRRTILDQGTTQKIDKWFKRD